jgi:hypothetical protein
MVASLDDETTSAVHPNHHRVVNRLSSLERARILRDMGYTKLQIIDAIFALAEYKQRQRQAQTEALLLKPKSLWWLKLSKPQPLMLEGGESEFRHQRKRMDTSKDHKKCAE